MSRDIAAILAYRPIVLKSLKAFIKHHSRDSGTSLAWKSDVAKRLMTFVTSGKLLRGSLVCYSYSLRRPGTTPSLVLNTAVALELSHAALLIHDDIIDQDDRRRGQPAIHQSYTQLFNKDQRSAGMATHLGESLALCAGDMTLLMAFELIGSVPSPMSGDPPLSSLLARELSTVCAGQMQDIYASGWPTMPTKREIFALMQAKSAGYSVAFPLMAGAGLAGQPAAVQRRLYALGLAAGTMFQIRDDELGVLGNADKLGKPVGSDIREGKKTLLWYYLRRSAADKERQRLDTIFGNPAASPADIATIQEALLQHNVPQKLQTDLDRLKRSAFRRLDQLGLASDQQRELQGFIEFCAARES